MTTLREGDIEIGLPSGAQGRKFDDNAVHGLSHAGMKAVDFIIEEDDRIVFVEIKDPDDPSADEGSRSRFVAQVRQGELDLDLARKYRDSFLYEWAAERVDSTRLSSPISNWLDLFHFLLLCYHFPRPVETF